MFRYDMPAFSASAELMRNVCRELSEYEEEIRVLSVMLDRNPEIPAPRHRLRKSLEALEQCETSLNLTRRKLDSVRRLYENAEYRICDLADETEGISREGMEYFRDKLNKNENPGFATRFLPCPNLDWVWPIPHSRIPRFYPAPYMIPYRPLRPVFPFPPRRPKNIIDWNFIRRILPFLIPVKGAIPAPRIEITSGEKEFVTLPYITDATDRMSEPRASRRARIRLLFGTDHS